MSDRTVDDVLLSNECNTYVMSCHLNHDALYKAMRQDLRIACAEIAKLLAERDEWQTRAEQYETARVNENAANCELTDAITKLLAEREAMENTLVDISRWLSSRLMRSDSEELMLARCRAAEQANQPDSAE